MPRRNKRGNGEGSVYQREDGKWIGAITVAGRRRVVYGRTRQETAQKVGRLLEAATQGTLPEPGRLTVGAYLSQWLETVAKPKVRPRTYDGYGVNIRNHILPALGSVLLARLTPQLVQRLINDKLEAGLNPKTVSYIRQVLRTAIEDAVRWNLVSHNVVSVVPAPRQVRSTIRPLEPEQIGVFLDAVSGRRLEALYVTALALGVRQGEALGLKWSDIDMTAGRMRIQRQLQRSAAGLHFVEPKTDRARRVLDLPPTVVTALADHKRRQWLEKLVAGSNWKENDLVFPTSIGTPLDARGVVRDFRDTIRSTDLPPIRFHDLRHSCATMLLVQGVPARVVMDILGHSEISLTMDTYTHVVPGLRQEAAAQMEKLLVFRRTDLRREPAELES